MDRNELIKLLTEIAGEDCEVQVDAVSTGYLLDAEHVAQFAQRIQPQWMPIESAPKDGTEIMLWEKYSDAPFVGWWVTGGHWAVSHEHVDAVGGWEGAIVVDRVEQKFITHWMPLPKPPEGNP